MPQLPRLLAVSALAVAIALTGCQNESGNPTPATAEQSSTTETSSAQPSSPETGDTETGATETGSSEPSASSAEPSAEETTADPSAKATTGGEVSDATLAKVITSIGGTTLPNSAVRPQVESMKKTKFSPTSCPITALGVTTLINDDASLSAGAVKQFTVTLVGLGSEADARAAIQRRDAEAAGCSKIKLQSGDQTVPLDVVTRKAPTKTADGQVMLAKYQGKVAAAQVMARKGSVIILAVDSKSSTDSSAALSQLVDKVAAQLP